MSVVNINDFQIVRVARLSFKAIRGKGLILVLHEVLCSVVNTTPQHLHLSIVNGGIARPVEPLLVNVATRYLCIAFLAVGMAQMGACLIVAVCIWVVGLHIVSKPYKILWFGAWLTILAHSLHHD